MSKKKKHAAEHENLERWLLTYADMITLLMAFFILMYTMSKVDSEKLSAVGKSLREQMGYEALLESPGFAMIKGLPDSNKSAMRIIGSANLIPAPYRVTVKNLSKTLKREGLQQQIKASIEKRGLVISVFSENLRFVSGSGEVNDEGKKILDILGNLLNPLPNSITIEGHTDKETKTTKKNQIINWDLSASRALSVLKFFVINGYIDENRLSVGAFASVKPFKTNATDPVQIQALNRRVDLVVSGELMPENSRAEIDLNSIAREQNTGW